MISSMICRFHYETDKVLGTEFVRCDINDLTIHHALCIEKNIVYYVISFKDFKKFNSKLMIFKSIILLRVPRAGHK